MRADADRSTRAGLVLFWIGAVWAIGWGIVGALVAAIAIGVVYWLLGWVVSLIA